LAPKITANLGAKPKPMPKEAAKGQQKISSLGFQQKVQFQEDVEMENLSLEPSKPV
jgi:hypothetical protein